MSGISVRSNYFNTQYSNNQLLRDLKQGRRGVVRNTSHGISCVYLPQNDKEPQHIYENRIRKSYLTNFLKRTIQSDSGKILSNPINTGDLPPEYEEWFDDMDLEGKSIQVLAKDQLQAAQYKGVTLAYVDFLSDEGRPFTKEIDIDDVLSFRTDSRTNRLTFLRFQSSIVDDSDEEHLTVDNKNVIFEITPTEWRVFEDDDEDTPIDGGEIIRYRNGSKRITNEIPVSIFYTNKTGLLLAESPYYDLAEMTIEHFQVSSETKNMLSYALTPFLFGKGIPEDCKPSSLASYIAVMLSDGQGSENASIEWIQADAAPLAEAREQIGDIESRISAFGIDANGIRPSGTQTATEKSIDSAGSNAALRMFAEGLAEHIERIVEIMSSYTLSPVNASVDITPDFTISDNSATVTNAIAASEKRIISKKTAAQVMAANNSLPKSYDYDEDQEQIQEEDAYLGLLGGFGNNTTTTPSQDEDVTE